jgi:hypothetical protein
MEPFTRSRTTPGLSCGSAGFWLSWAGKVVHHAAHAMQKLTKARRMESSIGI